MKIFFSIVLNLLCHFLYGQLIYQKPDSNLIARANSQVEVASLLINVDADFFKKSSKQLINGEQVYLLYINVQDARYLNIYFDELKISEMSVLEVYNEVGDLELKMDSKTNSKGGLYAIRPIKGSRLKFIFKGDKFDSKISISEIGYFWKSLDDLSSSGFCEVDVNCSEGEEWENQKNGVVRLLLKTNSSSIYCSGTLVNNTSRDCRPYVLSANHCVDNVSSDNLKQSFAYFNYENSSCDSENATSNNFMLGMTLRASTSFNNSSDVLLLELDDTIPLQYRPYFNGWSIINTIFSGGVSIHHPKGDVKKISTYTDNLMTAYEDGLNENAFWRVNWMETANGHGVTETGSSGAPIFNHEKLVVGVLSVGTSFCSKPEDPDYYGKVSYSWDGKLDSLKRLDVWLDPIQTRVESITGSYFPCDDTTDYYIPHDSMTIKLNPTSEGIGVYVEQSIANPIEVFLYDVSGKIILKKEEASSNITVIKFPTQNIRDGMYLTVVNAGNKQQIFKVVVVN